MWINRLKTYNRCNLLYDTKYIKTIKDIYLSPETMYWYSSSRAKFASDYMIKKKKTKVRKYVTGTPSQNTRVKYRFAVTSAL